MRISDVRIGRRSRSRPSAGLRAKPVATSAYTRMIFAKGNEHERDYLDRLVAAGPHGRGGRRTSRRDWQAGAARTEELMRAGADVIYQAPFALEGWRGIADFLERIDTPSELGDYSYEAVDTKLARNEMLPHHALQLCFYAAGIARVQGELAGVGARRARLGRARVDPRARDRLLRPPREGRHAARRRGPARRPSRSACDHCQFCEFRTVCEAHWEAVDHLTRVAGLRRDQMPLLAAAGVTTLTRLATAAAGCRPCPDLRPDVLGGTDTAGAAPARGGRRCNSAVRAPARSRQGRGFELLPEPSRGRRHVRLRGRPVLDAGARPDVPHRTALPRGRRLALRGDLGARPRRRGEGGLRAR